MSVDMNEVVKRLEPPQVALRVFAKPGGGSFLMLTATSEWLIFGTSAFYFQQRRAKAWLSNEQAEFYNQRINDLHIRHPELVDANRVLPGIVKVFQANNVWDVRLTNEEKREG